MANTAQLTATVEDSGGSTIPGASTYWTSEDPSIATVDQTGLVTAVAVGTTTIHAISGQASATKTVTVTTAAVPPNPTLGAIDPVTAVQGDTALSITVDGLDIPSDATLVFSATGITVDDLTVAGDGTGITGHITLADDADVGSGTVKIHSATTGDSSTLPFAVTAEAQTLDHLTMTLSASPVIETATAPTLTLGQYQTSGTSTPYTDTLSPANAFSSSAPSVASINATTGAITLHGPGTTTLTRTAGGKTVTATLTVTAEILSSTPSSLSVTVGAGPSAALVIKDQSSVDVTAGCTFASSNPSVATVSSSGVVTYVGAGSCDIVATHTVDNETCTIGVTVSAAAPEATTLVWLDSAPTLASIGATATLRAQIDDQYGVAMASQSGITITSGTTSVATISGTTITSVANGTSVMTAAYSGVTSITRTATVAQVLASIAVSGTAPTVGNTSTFTRSGKDALGVAMASQPTVVWASSNTAHATVNSSTGVVTGVAEGTTNITATSGAVVGTETITIAAGGGTAPTFTSITPNTIDQNTSGDFAIVGADLDADQSLSGLPSGVTISAWTVNSSTSVTATLAATAVATLGDADIVITDPDNGDSGSVTLTVAAGTPSGIPISALYLLDTAATVNPSGEKSSAFPLTHTSGSANWKKFGSTNASDGKTAFVQTTGGANSQSVFLRGWVSDTLSEQIIPAGTYGIAVSASTEGATYHLAPVVYIYRPSTDSVVGVIRDSATGIGTAMVSGSGDGKIVSSALATGFAIQSGDVLVLELWAVGNANEFVHFGYNGNGTITDNATTSTNAKAVIGFPSSIYLSPAAYGIKLFKASNYANDTALRAVIGSDSTTYSGSNNGTCSPSTALVSGSNVDLLTLDATTGMFKTRIPAGTASTAEIGRSVAKGGLPVSTGVWERKKVKFDSSFTTYGDHPGNADPSLGGDAAYKIGPHFGYGNYDGRCDIEIENGAALGMTSGPQDKGTGAGVASYVTSAGAINGINTSSLWGDGNVYWIGQMLKPVSATQFRQVVFFFQVGGTVTLAFDLLWTMSSGYSVPNVSTLNWTGFNMNRGAPTGADVVLYQDEFEVQLVEEAADPWGWLAAIGG